ncbi:MAG: cobalamin-binding protein [Dehalococcoidia bacterium]|nr:cobalamin-binding protein [Dehalococcoidia bacterium]
MKKIAVLLLSLVLCAMTLLTSACTNTESSSALLDDLGRPIVTEGKVERIVSLGPSITEMLFALGLGDRVVGVTDWCDYPEAAKSLPKVGSAFPGFDIEAIVNLEPDLILSVAGTIVEDLRARGLQVAVLQPRDIQGLYRDFELIGTVTDAEKTAAKVVSDLKQRVEAVAAKTSRAAERPRVFYEVDASMNEDKPWTTGHGTFQDDLINMAGGTNIAAARSGWYELSIEEILDADPDIIILEDYQYGATPESVASRPAWTGLTAVKEGRVFAIEDPNLTCRYGPRLVDGLELLARVIHPELFP